MCGPVTIGLVLPWQFRQSRVVEIELDLKENSILRIQAIMAQANFALTSSVVEIWETNTVVFARILTN